DLTAVFDKAVSDPLPPCGCVTRSRAVGLGRVVCSFRFCLCVLRYGELLLRLPLRRHQWLESVLTTGAVLRQKLSPLSDQVHDLLEHLRLVVLRDCGVGK